MTTNIFNIGQIHTSGNTSSITPWTTVTTTGNVIASPAVITAAPYTGPYTVNTSVSNSTLTINGDKIEFKTLNGKNALIVTNKNTIDIDALYETVQILAEKLMILVEDEYILEKHPTLRDAYDAYKLCYALVNPNKKES